MSMKLKKIEGCNVYMREARIFLLERDNICICVHKSTDSTLKLPRFFFYPHWKVYLKACSN